MTRMIPFAALASMFGERERLKLDKFHEIKFKEIQPRVAFSMT
jgi:hypothetical protein